MFLDGKLQSDLNPRHSQSNKLLALPLPLGPRGPSPRLHPDNDRGHHDQLVPLFNPRQNHGHLGRERISRQHSRRVDRGLCPRINALALASRDPRGRHLPRLHGPEPQTLHKGQAGPLLDREFDSQQAGQAFLSGRVEGARSHLVFTLLFMC